jgi:HlyD family secretion protein
MNTCRFGFSIPLLLFALLAPPLVPEASAEAGGAVTALGRLEPAGGVIRVSGPSLPAVVISKLLVEEGDLLEAGQPIAHLDTYARQRATVEAMRARLQGTEQELARSKKLQAGRVTATAKFDEAQTEVRVAKAQLAGARAELAMSEVKAPSAGQVLAVHTRAGERVGPDGIIELGRTNEMYAIAEVYETDIGRVAEGQTATITSSALPRALAGVVERIGMMVAKMDVLDTDPVARTDARVVEVAIRIDEGQEVARLTYLQVRVEIHP